MTTTQTAEQIAEAMDNFSKFNNLLLGNHKSHMPDQHKEAAAMLHQQAAEIECLKDMHNRLKKMVDEGSINGRMYSTLLEQEAEIDRLRSALAGVMPMVENWVDCGHDFNECANVRIRDAARAALEGGKCPI
jgi:hypothetical protein